MYGDLINKEKLKYCYQCGKCSSGCDINRIDPSFRPHRLLRLIGMGATGKLLEKGGIWKCTTCFTCSERCPQGVKVTEILWLARAMTVGSGHISEWLAAQRDLLLRTGRLVPIDNKKREKNGLAAMQVDSSLVARIFEITKKEE